MNLIVDKDLPYVREAFGPIGNAQFVETARLTPAGVTSADALVVRSTVRVDAALLEGSNVKFVGTATIGTDHVDAAYLASRGIAFASAPGSNANSVKEYVVSALLECSARRGWTPGGATIGIVGVGHVGSKVRQAAEALGMRALLNDPPLARRTGDPRFVPLDELMGADVITLHVPLTKHGPDATYHLFDEARFGRLKEGAIFINTSRGGVVKTRALAEAIARKRIAASVIDVWENEPDIDTDLLRSVTIGTPHIAGYSMEGKTNAVGMIRKALCSHFGIDLEWNPPGGQGSSQASVLDVSSLPGTEDSVLRSIVANSYDITIDDAMLRGIVDRAPAKRGEYFAKLRSDYRERHEFSTTTVRLPREHARVAPTLAALGFEQVIVAHDVNREEMSNRKRSVL